MPLLRRLSALALAVALRAEAAAAQPTTVDGVTFSDERGGFVITGASGSGRLADPFVVVEEVRGPGAAVLVIRGVTAALGNRVGTAHQTGFALRKVVTNRTDAVWTFVEFELQERLGVPSDTYDGLSFGQGAEAGRPFASDRFARAAEINDALDYVSFQDGTVAPGETAVFDVIITDTTPASIFYLIQRPNQPLSLDNDAASAMRAISTLRKVFFLSRSRKASFGITR